MLREEKELVYSPTQQQNKNNYSLSADLATGWRPKMKIIGPMPLNFDNYVLDGMINQVLSSDTSMFSIVYLGIRPQNTLLMHQLLAKKYRYKYDYLLDSDFTHLKPFFKKFYNEFQPETKRPFYGMNPKLKQNLQFDSCFEGGNLDCVVKVRNNEYDLVLRVDSNTAGHIMWFDFKVKNILKQKRTVIFNIVNLRRGKFFYNNVSNHSIQTLKPFIKRKGREWVQGGHNISIKDEKISFDHSTISISQGFDDYDSPLFRKLSFSADFDPEEQVQFAYSVPYTYSQLLSDIKIFKKLAQQSTHISLKIDYKNESLSGLEIPHLRIGQQSEEQSESEQKKKYCIFIIGRQHPGESNGSHVMKGIIEGLLKMENAQSKQMMKSVVFHIIPMVNPDGVVMGNFRTSLFGKDLNRLFNKTDVLMVPEVEICKNMVDGFLRKHKKGRLILFLDIHGHSVRRNSFCYGPGSLNTQGYEDIREFPRIISQLNNIFRFPSCSFRIADEKKTTARAIFSRLISLCYTIESSNWSYVLSTSNKVFDFGSQKWMQVGSSIAEAMNIFMNKIFERKKRYYEKKQLQKLRRDASLQKKIKPVTQKNKIHLKTITNEKSIKKIKKSEIFHAKINSEKHITSGLIEEEDNEIDFIRKSQRKQKIENQQIEDNENKENDSDNSEEEDMEGEKFKKYINAASKMFIQFEKAYYGDEYDQKKNYNASKVLGKRKIEEKMMPCLKNQHEKFQNSSSSSPKKQKRSNISKALSYNNNQLSELKKEKFPKLEIVSSLPKISIINYLAHEEMEEKKIIEKSIKKESQTVTKSQFKIPKIETQFKRKN